MKPSISKVVLCIVVTVVVAGMLSGAFPVTARAVPGALDAPRTLAGKTVFLDPGHQGPNHTEDLSRPVSDGRGGTKACQTTGMTTRNGVPEHTVTWSVAQLAKVALEGLGAHVVLSRRDDSGWGGCIDDRARAASRSHADVAVSIHADGAPAQYHGFHLIVPELPIPNASIDRAQSGSGRAASKAVRDAYRKAGFVSANYGGVVDGLQIRRDIAGPALTTVPVVFLEMGNGADPADAALLETPEGQLHHAIALTTGLVGYLLGTSPPDRSTAQTSPQPGTTSGGSAVRRSSPQADPGASLLPGTPPGTVPAEPQARDVPVTQEPPSAPDAQAETGTLAELLEPLATMLGVDSATFTTELIDFLYTLASMLLAPRE
ncbi:N-acetylmuramoyl-L-alanine amidase [Nocardia sp. 004]|uniref:N-acetylmuramoyl-L-alanine amidase n=1 Tax=Nocardia sp. 004 TaxID=3385978 RepID=UPI00399FA342